MSGTTRVCLVLKLASRAWRTREELAAAAEVHRNNLKPVIEDLLEEGLLVERTRAKHPSVPGFAPQEFTVSRAWGGTADV